MYNFFVKWNFFFNYRIFILELTYKFIYSILLFFITAIFCYWNIDSILYLLSKYLLTEIQSHRFLFNNLIQIFYIHLKLAFFFSIILSVPFIFFNYISFFLSSFFKKEAYFYGILSLVFIIIYYLNIYFISNSIIPNFLNFFLYFENNNAFFPLHFEAKFEDYFSLILSLYINFYIILLLPLITYMFIKLNFIKISNIILFKKYIYIFFLFLSILLSPPDLFNQIIILSFNIIIFEIFILFQIFFKNL
jgi:sec-independent protein translocase protein TatC